MRQAITKGREDPSFPFGAVIVRATDLTVMASGVNTTRRNPTFHGEIDAINDYVRQHGSEGWERMILYTTGLPCPMRMSAIVWVGMGGVVFGGSIETLSRVPIRQIDISSASVRRAAPFYHGSPLGGMLASGPIACSPIERAAELQSKKRGRADWVRARLELGWNTQQRSVNAADGTVSLVGYYGVIHRRADRARGSECDATSAQCLAQIRD